MAGEAVCIVTDVTVRAAIEACVAATVERYGSLEIVVHNALAGAIPHRLEDIDFGHALGRDVADVGVGLVLVRPGGVGRIWRRPVTGAGSILVTSPSAVEGSNNIPMYSPAKAAQRALAKSLAKQWGPHGVTVNCVAPVAESPALAGAFAGNPALKAAIEARTPLRRIGDPELDIGSVASFLVSDDAELRHRPDDRL